MNFSNFLRDWMYKTNITDKPQTYVGFPAGPSYQVKYSNDKTLWHPCREVFYWRFKRSTKTIYLSYNHPNVKTLAKFFAAIEWRMKLKPKDRLKFITYENAPLVVGVEVSAFWRFNRLRRELLTILLRAAFMQKKMDYEKIINSDAYLCNTKKALKLFISGKTKLKKQFRGRIGWFDTFALDPQETSLLI